MEHSALPILDILERAYEEVDSHLSQLTQGDGGDHSGCVAATAFLRIEDQDGKQSFLHGPDSDSHSLNESQEVPESPSLSSSSSGHSPATNLPTTSEIFTPTDPNPRRVLYCANVGESRAVLCRSGKAKRLNQDHRTEDEGEAKRVKDAGGIVLLGRVYIDDMFLGFT